MRKTAWVEILGEQVLLSERDTGDVMNLVSFSATHTVGGKDSARTIFELVKVVQDGLKYHISSVKWYQPLKRFRYARKFSIKNLLLISLGELIILKDIVLRLEGIDPVALEEEEKKTALRPIDAGPTTAS